MEISIKWNVCRVCLQEESQGQASREAILIFSGGDAKLPTQIFEITGVLMKLNDSLPEKICRKCLNLLRNAINFRNTCRNSDEYLQSIIQKTKSATKLFKPDRRRGDHFTESGDAEPIFDVQDSDDGEQQQNDSVKRKRDEWRQNQLNSQEKTTVPIEETSLAVATVQDSMKVGCTLPETNSNNRIVIDSTDLEVVEQKAEESEEKKLNEIENDLKNDLLLKSSSECSVDEYGYDDEDEGNSEAYHEDEEFTNRSGADIKRSVPIESQFEGTVKVAGSEVAANIDEDTEELFYILNDTNIKREYGTDEESTAIEMIQMTENEAVYVESCGKSENTAATLENVVEFLIEDNVDEHFQYDLEDTKEASPLQSIAITATSSKTQLQRIPTRKKSNTTSVFVCDVCGNNFTSRGLLNYHMRIHRNEKNYECELCFKRFNAACNLTAHMRIHTGEKPYECHYCGRRFADRSTHIKHERTHTNEKPFSCKICAKSFALSTTLRAHERVHTGEKPFKCETCDKYFKLPHQLKAHRNTELHKLVSAEKLYDL